MKLKTGLLTAALVLITALPARALDYQTVVTQELIPRCNTALTNIANSLIAAGLPASGVTVSMPDTTDLRFQIVAKNGSKTMTAYIELTDASHTGGAPGTAVLTLWVSGNGVELTSDYAPGTAKSYISDDGLTALLAKLTDLEGNIPAVAVKVRAFLGL